MLESFIHNHQILFALTCAISGAIFAVIAILIDWNQRKKEFEEIEKMGQTILSNLHRDTNHA